MKLEEQNNWTIKLRNLKGLLSEENYKLVKKQIKEAVEAGTLKVTYPNTPDEVAIVYSSPKIVVGKVIEATDTQLVISLDNSERAIELKEKLARDIAGKFDAVRRIACYDDVVEIKYIDIIDFENSVLNVNKDEESKA